MKKYKLKDKITELETNNQILEAFILQSAYIESLIKLFVDYKTTIVLQKVENTINLQIKEKLINDKSSIYDLINLIFNCCWLDLGYKDDFERYRIKRNEIIHELLRKTGEETFVDEVTEVFTLGKKITNISELSFTNKFHEVLGSSRDTQIRNRKKAFVNLSDKETRILNLRISGKTYAEIGDLNGVSRERIRQILRDTIIKLEGKPTIIPSVKGLSKNNLDYKSIDTIFAKAVEFYGISKGDILSKSRKASFVFSRHMIIYSIRKNLNISYPEIAKIMHRGDHTTIMHAYRKIENLIKQENVSN